MGNDLYEGVKETGVKIDRLEVVTDHVKSPKHVKLISLLTNKQL